MNDSSIPEVRVETFSAVRFTDLLKVVANLVCKLQPKVIKMNRDAETLIFNSLVKTHRESYGRGMHLMESDCVLISSEQTLRYCEELFLFNYNGVFSDEIDSELNDDSVNYREAKDFAASRFNVRAYQNQQTPF